MSLSLKIILKQLRKDILSHREYFYSFFTIKKREIAVLLSRESRETCETHKERRAKRSFRWPPDLVLFLEMQRGRKATFMVAKGELTNGKDLSGATAGVRAFFIGEKRAARYVK